MNVSGPTSIERVNSFVPSGFGMKLNAFFLLIFTGVITISSTIGDSLSLISFTPSKRKDS